jgi:hypothetical protein
MPHRFKKRPWRGGVGSRSYPEAIPFLGALDSDQARADPLVRRGTGGRQATQKRFRDG